MLSASTRGETEAGVPVQEGSRGQASNNRGEETEAEGCSRWYGWHGLQLPPGIWFNKVSVV